MDPQVDLVFATPARETDTGEALDAVIRGTVTGMGGLGHLVAEVAALASTADARGRALAGGRRPAQRRRGRYGDIRKALLSAPAIADADRSLPVPATPHD